MQKYKTLATINSSDSKKPLSERLKDRYRLVVLNDETFEEVSSSILSLGNIYAIISSFVVILGLFIILFIIFTPVKKLIPGYADFESNPKFIQLTRDLDQIQDSLKMQQIYIQGIKNLLTSDGTQIEYQNTSDSRALIEDNRIAQPQNENGSTETMIQKRTTMGRLDLQAPLTGIISSDFNPESKHLGIDILAPKGSAIKAIQDGHVIVSGWNLETGHTLGIQHTDNVISFYKHNLKNLKAAGEYVKAGEAIAIIGNSGTLSDGPHLHFELWHDGNPLNPIDYLNFK